MSISFIIIKTVFLKSRPRIKYLNVWHKNIRFQSKHHFGNPLITEFPILFFWQSSQDAQIPFVKKKKRNVINLSCNVKVFTILYSCTDSCHIKYTEMLIKLVIHGLYGARTGLLSSCNLYIWILNEMWRYVYLRDVIYLHAL